MTALRTEEDAPRGLVSRAEYYRALAKIEALEDRLADVQGKLDRAQGLRHLGRLHTLLGRHGMTSRACAALYEANGAVLQLHYLAEVCHVGTRVEDTEHLFALRKTMSMLRAGLRKLGAPEGTIQVVCNVGYYMTPEGVAWLREKLEGEQ